MKTQNPWMGRARGSAGNMTSSKVYDKNVMRAKAFEVNNPKTAAQTNERNFFSAAQSVCQTVSEEQLRSLFGVKPKSKSRRNMLLSQLLGMRGEEQTGSFFDVSKFLSIGNGEKVSTPFIERVSPENIPLNDITVSMLGEGADEKTQLLLVGVIVPQYKIVIVKTDICIEDELENFDLTAIYPDTEEFSGYWTCSSDKPLSDEIPFGSFKIKTRAV